MLNEKVIFAAELCPIENDNLKSKGILTTKNIIWEYKTQGKTLDLDDVVGAFSTGNNSLVVNAYHLNPKKQRILTEYNFICINDYLCSLWLTAINNTLLGKSAMESSPPRHLHLILNPISGQKKARKILNKILPVLQKSYLQFEIIETTNKDKYDNFIEKVTPNDTDGLVVIGGDGTVYELLNQLRQREDWETAISIPIGIIPAGTSNGLAKSLLVESDEIYDPINAAFIIVKGKVKPIDIVQIKQDYKISYSLLSIAWGLVSEIDIESDKLRFIGPLKTNLYFIKKLFNIPSYRGKFSFLPVVNGQVQEKWQVIEHDFIVFWAMNVPWAAYNLKAAPKAELSDGAIDVVIIKKGIKKRQLLKAFLSVETGEHISLPYLEYYKISAFKLEPYNPQDILAIDGEQVQNLPIEVKVLKGAGKVFCRGLVTKSVL